MQGCRLFKWCWNLPAGHCVAGVQAVYAMLEPICLALCCRGAGCLSGVGTHQPDNALSELTSPALLGRGAGILSSVGTYLLDTVFQGCRLFKLCRNLPSGHCVAGVQAVKAMLKPACLSLCCRGAGCLSGVGTYLPALCCRVQSV